jgi:hypothetical protein
MTAQVVQLDGQTRYMLQRLRETAEEIEAGGVVGFCLTVVRADGEEPATSTYYTTKRGMLLAGAVSMAQASVVDACLYGEDDAT